MSMETARGSAGRLRTPRWRLSTILVLLAFCLLLCAPGAATAHVRAKYRAEYKQMLTGMQETFGRYAHTYDEFELQSSSLAATLAPMIGDPDKREDLLAGEDYARRVWTDFEGQPESWFTATEKYLHILSAKASRYFASASDRRRYRELLVSLQPLGRRSVLAPPTDGSARCVLVVRGR